MIILLIIFFANYLSLANSRQIDFDRRYQFTVILIIILCKFPKQNATNSALILINIYDFIALTLKILNSYYIIEYCYDFFIQNKHVNKT